MTRPRRAPATLLIALFGACLPAWGADECPVPEEVVYPDVGEDPKIEFTADSAEVTPEGVSVFRGSVTVRQGYRELEAGEVHYDSRTGHVSVDGRATFREPAFEVSAEDADFDPATGEAEFFDSTFTLPSRPARGRADRVAASGTGRVSLDNVRYTTCMDDDPDWELEARNLELDLKESRGEARRVKLGFQNVPIAISYIVAMLLLGVHLRHGVASLFQTLGLRHPKYEHILERGGQIAAWGIVIGNISIPLTILAGLVKLPSS